MSVITSGAYTLRHDTGTPVVWGEDVRTFRGDFVMVEGGRAPQHSGSSGRVWVRYPDGTSAEYFPTVLSLVWVDDRECGGTTCVCGGC